MEQGDCVIHPARWRWSTLNSQPPISIPYLQLLMAAKLLTLLVKPT